MSLGTMLKNSTALAFSFPWCYRQSGTQAVRRVSWLHILNRTSTFGALQHSHCCRTGELRGLCFMQPSNKTRREYAEVLCKSLLLCHDLHDEYLVRRIFIEGLVKLTRHIIGSYCSSKNATWHDFVRHSRSLSILQYGPHFLVTSWNKTEPKAPFGKRNEWMGPWNSTAGTHMIARSTRTFQTLPFSTASLSIMALQLSNSTSR